MPTCKECGAQLADDAQACPNCEAQVVDSPGGEEAAPEPPPIPVAAAPLTPPPPPSPAPAGQQSGQLAKTATPSSAESFWKRLSPPVQIGLMISPATLVLEILNAMTGCIAMLITKPLLLFLFVYQGVLLARKLAAHPGALSDSPFRLGTTSGLVAQALPAIWWTVFGAAAAGATVGVALVALPFVIASMALTIGANMLVTGFMTKRQYAKLTAQ